MIGEEYDRQLENFVHNVVWLRKHYGISKKKMAEILGIGVASLNKIEDGFLPPKIGINIFLIFIVTLVSHRNFNLSNALENKNYIYKKDRKLAIFLSFCFAIL